MYDYTFEFFKPGKRFYTPDEIGSLLEFFQFPAGSMSSSGFEIIYHGKPILDLNTATVSIQPDPKRLDVDLKKEDTIMGFHLGVAEGPHGVIGGIFLSEEEFEANPRRAVELFSDAAITIFNVLHPYFAWADHELELDKLSHCLSLDRIGALAWQNWFSKEFVRKLGGVENLLLDPNSRKEREDAEFFFKKFSLVRVELSGLPTEATSFQVALECERRYPGALLRSFEIPSVNAIEAEP